MIGSYSVVLIEPFNGSRGKGADAVPKEIFSNRGPGVFVPKRGTGFGYDKMALSSANFRNKSRDCSAKTVSANWPTDRDKTPHPGLRPNAAYLQLRLNLNWTICMNLTRLFGRELDSATKKSEFV